MNTDSMPQRAGTEVVKFSEIFEYEKRGGCTVGTLNLQREYSVKELLEIQLEIWRLFNTNNKPFYLVTTLGSNLEGWLNPRVLRRGLFLRKSADWVGEIIILNANQLNLLAAKFTENPLGQNIAIIYHRAVGRSISDIGHRTTANFAHSRGKKIVLIADDPSSKDYLLEVLLEVTSTGNKSTSGNLEAP